MLTRIDSSWYSCFRTDLIKLLCETFQNSKKNFCNNLDVKEITDNKLFWKAVKPDFTNKTFRDEWVTLVEDGNGILEESELAELFNNYFGSIAEGLDLERPEISSEYNNQFPPIMGA